MCSRNRRPYERIKVLCPHNGRRGVCIVRYDNETVKGDHRHVRGRELPYEFKSVEPLRREFEDDVKAAGGKDETDA